ncbi:MAG TPA: hypothetical protein VKA89_00110 [Solirubrobacterales bacterium]|nr:hypothetical protein [Solirubrobacterales bacterium]
MTPSFGAYVGGGVALIGIAAALGLGGYWLRRWIVPEFSGALARLAEITIAVGLFVLTLELLGTVGAFRLGWIVLGCIAAGLVAAWLAHSRAPRGAVAVEPPKVHTWALVIAVGVASWAAAEWTFPSQLSLDHGMFGGDTTWYHMPFAARFVQDASITDLHLTDPLRLAAWFYPQSSELVNAASIAVTQSDWLSPLINLVWLCVGLLACWCVGRPYNVAPATLVAGALVLDSGIFIETQAGEGRNDVMALAFLVAMAAFLINGHQRRAPATGVVADTPDPTAPLLDRGPLILAGLAGGLAISVKLTMLAPIGAIFLGMVIASNRGRRLTTAAVMGASMFVTGAYWYVRAMIHTGGNPTPQLSYGPLNLPTPDQMPLDPRPRFSVADYLFEPTIYRKWFFPELDNALGPLYPLILIIAFAATVYIVLRSRNRILRLLAGAALLTAIVYIFTPLTAAGPEGEPRGFFTNTRYLMPGLMLGLVMLPLARPLRAPERRAWATLISLTLVYAITVLATPRWYPYYIVGTVFIVAAMVWLPAGLGYLRGIGRVSIPMIGAAVAGVLLLALVLGRAQQVQYVDNHYKRTTLFLQEGGPVKAFDWARPLRDKRIGIVGSGEIFFSQYGFYGVDLSNRVDFVGVPGDRGTYRLATTCRQLRNRINAGDYDFLVVSQYTQDSPDAEYRYPVRAWTKTDPGLEEVLAEEEITPQPDYVYRVKGDLDPAGCADLGAS